MFAAAKIAICFAIPLVVVGAYGLSTEKVNSGATTSAWSPKSAAAYLDSRTKSWMSGGAIDHGTFCISCHTALPYALARPAIRSALGELERSSVETQLLESVSKRVKVWDEVQPYLGDKTGGLPSESVLNALVLAEEDARKGRMSDTTKAALKLMWSHQMKTGERAGAWQWFNFGNEPWEAPDSEYWGATLAAVAAGDAPEGYLGTPQIQADLGLLKAYLRKDEETKSLFNRLNLLWASTKVPGIISAEHRATIVSDALAVQQADGGWSTGSLIPSNWARRDKTPRVTTSDGFGTGMVAFVLEQAGVRRSRPAMQMALSWLSRNQDPTTGGWPTSSPNVTRDASTDVGKFMTDAATAYAVLALSNPG